MNDKRVEEVMKLSRIHMTVSQLLKHAALRADDGALDFLDYATMEAKVNNQVKVVHATFIMPNFNLLTEALQGNADYQELMKRQSTFVEVNVEDNGFLAVEDEIEAQEYDDGL